MSSLVKRAFLHVDGDAFHPAAKALDGSPLKVSIATDPRGVAKGFFDQIQQDHEVIKRVFVNGSCQINPDQTVTVKSARDPCHGFLNIRPEVAIELVRGQKLRWGACMFGSGPDASGDVMHFDLGTHFGTTGAPPKDLNKTPGS